MHQKIESSALTKLMRERIPLVSDSFFKNLFEMCAFELKCYRKLPNCSWIKALKNNIAPNDLVMYANDYKIRAWNQK